MKIDCSDFKKYLDAYFDEELADAERAEFDAHVAVCCAGVRLVEGGSDGGGGEFAGQHVW